VYRGHWPVIKKHSTAPRRLTTSTIQISQKTWASRKWAHTARLWRPRSSQFWQHTFTRFSHLDTTKNALLLLQVTLLNEENKMADVQFCYETSDVQYDERIQTYPQVYIWTWRRREFWGCVW